MNFPTLLLIIAGLLLVLRFIRASIKLMTTATVIAIVVYIIMHVLPF